MGMYAKEGDVYVDGIDCQSAQDGMTKQEFKKATDINEMIAKLDKTGLLDVMSSDPKFGDVSEVVDFQDAMNIVVKGREIFDSYPAQIRERFLNDPARLIGFLADESNYDEAVKLGMAVKRKEVEVPPVVPAVKP